MCSISGVIALKTVDPGEVTLYASILGGDVQHRGHEWIGIAYSSGDFLRIMKMPGLVSSIFGDHDLVTEIGKDSPQMMMLQTRYSTQGESTSRNAQPQYLRLGQGNVALGSNGDLFDYKSERALLEKNGRKFESRNDAEVLVQQITYHSADDPKRFDEGIKHVMENTRASYSAWLATDNRVKLFRDPFANRPFFYMQVGDYFIFSSEDCALYGILSHRAEEGKRDGTVAINQVLPGEIITINLHGSIERQQAVEAKSRLAFCPFEYIYFGRPDSHIFIPKGNNPLCYKIVVIWENGEYSFDYVEDSTEEINSFRYRLGKALAVEYPVEDADCIISIPASGDLAAMGYSDQSGIVYRSGLVRNPYVTRTFITPGLETRERLAAIKYRPMRALFRKRSRIVVVDDSIVYGTSMHRIVRILKAAGAQEIHLRISCPPIVAACRYGIDMKSKGTLIAADKSVQEIQKHLRVASLQYLSLDVLKEVIGDNAKHACFACWDKNFRI
ncbi:hypothetical protein IID19_04340 [Patescibacteria group bacterium]|nr:hypothetical protein [Patescibacteria group bacterium]